MKSLLFVAAALVTATFVLAPVFAGGAPQTTCPVTGKSIDKATSPHLDIQGQRIYFCSKECARKLKADPETFFGKLASSGVELENIQTTCPVSGEKLGSMGESPSLSYKGRTVRFCCKACIKDFQADPARFLAKLPGEQTAAR